MKSSVVKYMDKASKESLQALESLTDIRAKLVNFDTEKIDLLIDHKLDLVSQFTPRNTYDYPEDSQVERLARLTDLRSKLSETNFGLLKMDTILKKSLDNLMMTTGVTRAHSVSLQLVEASIWH